MEMATKRTAFQGRKHSKNLLGVITARSAALCLSGPELLLTEASRMYAQSFTTDSCVMALEGTLCSMEQLLIQKAALCRLCAQKNQELPSSLFTREQS